jgi:hypothetical protein
MIGMKEYILYYYAWSFFVFKPFFKCENCYLSSIKGFALVEASSPP